ncbi:diguanylate cyclase [Rhizobium leguminosarum]|uniref:diguanylate cyclase n=1 Tax=Rhizobium leguminosarum TaxID=384 RepID=UPI003A9086B8
MDNFKTSMMAWSPRRDVVLRDFAHRIHQNVRRNDCFGRVGGEEFLLVMPATGPEDAIAMVECMLTVIRFSRLCLNHPTSATPVLLASPLVSRLRARRTLSTR